MKASTWVIFLWSMAAIFWGVVTIAHSAGWRINHTGSLPMGLWRGHAVDGPMIRGQIISFCPPDNALFQKAYQRGYLTTGSCPGGYEPLLKPVAAIAGDLVQVDAKGIAVNGRRLTNSAAASNDREGRPMPELTGTYRVAKGTIWVVSEYSSASFDSRYFGALPLSQILIIMQP